MRWVVAACIALAALSLVLSSTPGNDPWVWSTWGRELVHLDLDTSVGASWKPLPVLFTAPLSLFGDLAPAGWLVIARAGGLLGIVFAFRLAFRLSAGQWRPGGRERAIAIGAGVLACVPLALMSELTTTGGAAGLGYLRYIADGLSEGLVVAFMLWAVERAVDGRHDHALAGGFVAALVRPELWPFLAVYGVVVARREPRLRPLVAALLVTVPALWILPEWWGSGDPLGAQSRAAESVSEHGIGGDPGLVLKRMNALLIGPVEFAAVVAVAFSVRRREVAPLVLAGTAAAWVAGSALASLAGYPGVARLLVPAAAFVFVLGGLGAARLVQALGGGRAAIALGLALALAASPFALRSVRRLPTVAEAARHRQESRDDLARVLADVGGPRAVTACGRPVIASLVRYSPAEAIRSITGWPRAYLAWELHVPVRRVGRRLPRWSRSSVVILGGRRSLGLGPPPPVRVGQSVRLLAEDGRWQVFLFAHRGFRAAGCKLAYR